MLGRVVMAALGAVWLGAVWLGAVAAWAQPTPGFIEEWPGTSVQGWTGGTPLSNPGTGGVGGANDGYLHLDNRFPRRMGTYSEGPEYVGDWIAAGVRSVKVWLKDVGEADVFEIHFGIGVSNVNFWQYDVGFRPSATAWTQFVVNLDDSTRFTRLFGTGSFSEALRTTAKIHFRHDLPPFLPEPDQDPELIAGEVGIDRLELSSTIVPVRATTWARLKALYGVRPPSTR